MTDIFERQKWWQIAASSAPPDAIRRRKEATRGPACAPEDGDEFAAGEHFLDGAACDI